MDQQRYPPAALAWLVWGLGAALYFAGFFHRVAPAVMTDRLRADFRIGAAALGNFSAFYFYSYFLMQVPTGILSDYWGPRRLLTAGALVGACGTFLFASVSSILGAMILQPAVGWLLDLAWSGTFSGGARIYEPNAYRLGFLPIAVFSAIALLSIEFASETGSRQREDREESQ